ncbi:MAG: hypothetical protein AAF614_30170 [Chloroflexota bacterium]
MKMKRTISSIIAICTLLLGWTQPLFAHGEGETLQLSQVVVGTYHLSVWSSPSYLRPGEVHFSAVLADAAKKPILNHPLEILITPLDSSADPIRLQTRNATAVTHFRYETEYWLTENGRYQIEVFIPDTDNSVNFDIEIIDTPPFIQLPIYLSFAMVGFGLLMLLSRGLTLFNLWRPTTIQRPIKRQRNHLTEEALS